MDEIKRKMNVTKETRQESYLKIEPSKRCKLILSVLTKPMTARQIAYALHFSDLNAVKPRLTEMVEDGLIEAFEKAYDETTGRKVAVYRRIKNGF